MSSMHSRRNQSRKWLREASMKRLSLLVKDKTELIDSAQKLRMTVLSLDGLEESGLSSVLISHLENWVDGVKSGRQCMLALLESSQSDSGLLRSKHEKSSSEFRPEALMQSLLNLPDDFLCDQGYLFHTVFNRPPATVVKEAVQIVVQKAEEQSSAALGLQQINLAIKQLRLDAMCGTNPLPDSADTLDADSEATDGSNGQPQKTCPPVHNEKFKARSQIILRVQILTELLRIHVKSTLRRKSSYFNLASETIPVRVDETENEVDLQKLTFFLRTSTQSYHSDDADELEESNNVLKPYLRRLSSLKTTLSLQLTELRDSKAFLSLGLSSSATDEDIKRAYRLLAVRLHPDKPGGDTAAFQQLQAAYQEVLQRRKVKAEEENAVEELQKQRQAQKMKKSSFMSESKSPSAEGQAAKTKTKTKKPTFFGHDEEADDDEDDITEEEVKAKDYHDCEESESMDDDNEPMTETHELDELLKRQHTATTVDSSDDDSEDDMDMAEEESSEEVKSSSPPLLSSPPSKHTSSFRVDDVNSDSSDGSDDDNDNEFDILKSHFNQDLLQSPRTTTAGSSSSSSLAGSSQRAQASLHLFIPPLPSLDLIYDDDDKALTIIEFIDTLLQLMHKAATIASTATQKLVRLQKACDKLVRTARYPALIAQLTDLLSAAVAADNSSNDNKAAGEEEAQTGLVLELLCDLLQRVANFAMTFASDCGSDYAMATATHAPFLKGVEEAMRSSLKCLTGVAPLMTAYKTFRSAIQRASDSLSLAGKNLEIHELLVDMLKTGMKNTVATHCVGVDLIVASVQQAAKVRDQLKSLYSQARLQAELDVKRRAAMMREAREMESEYSFEDREAVKQARFGNAAKAAAQQQADEASAADQPDNKKKAAADAENDKGLTGLDLLKDKIKQLQVQLYLQQVQALQTLNAETLSLQDHILQELQSLTMFTSSSSSASASKGKSNGEKGGLLHILPAKMAERVFSLLAEMMDASLSCLRISLQNERSYDQSKMMIVMDKELAWLTIPLADGSKLDLITLLPALSSADTAVDGESGKEEVERVIKVALLPEYRSKTLYLASILDMTSLKDLIHTELANKLQEILEEGRDVAAAAIASSLPAEKSSPIKGGFGSWRQEVEAMLLPVDNM